MSRSEISVPIATKLFLDLVELLRSRGSDRDPVDAIHAAIEQWMAITASDETSTVGLQDTRTEAQSSREPEGYWWKGIFIPNRSKARMVYKGRTFIADVTADGFLLDGKAHSPSELTWAVTGTARNAWRDLEIQYPERTTWMLADDLRKQMRK